MMVLILHPTEQFKITNFQNQLCSIVNQKNTVLFPHFPLWFPIPDGLTSDLTLNDKDLKISNNNLKTTLKNLSNKIDKLSIDIFYSEQKQIPLLQLNIISNGKNFTSTLPLLNKINTLSDAQWTTLNNELKKTGSSELFPMSLKIFRVAKAVKLSENSQGLQAFVWKKLK